MPALVIFYTLVVWAECTPITEIEAYSHLLELDQKVPPTATCFSDSHMTSIAFYSFPSIMENFLLFSSMLLSLIVFIVLLIPSTKKLLGVFKSEQ